MLEELLHTPPESVCSFIGRSRYDNSINH